MDFSLAQLARDIAGLTPREHGFTYLDTARLKNPAPASKAGDLDGWVLSVKDLTDVAGMPTSYGALARTRMAKATDPFIAALERRGALVIGKSATPELGLRIDTEPVGLPHPDNPLHPGATPGGSSGGAAVQAARGLLRAAHASDGGGSIRVPAAACGVVGFKPSGTDLTVPGFITRTVADAALLHELEPQRARARIGKLSEPLFADVDVDPIMLRALDEAADTLRSAGHEVIDIAPYPTADDTFEAFRHIFTTRLNRLPAGEGYVEWVRQQGLRVSAAQLRAAHQHAAGLKSMLAAYWRCDAVLSPTLAFDPPPVGTFLSLPHAENFAHQTRWSPWGSLFNVAHLPAISVPWQVRGRAPVGIQLGGIMLADAPLLALASILHP